MDEGEVEVRVEAIGLNFRDVLNAPMLHWGLGFKVYCLGFRV